MRVMALVLTIGQMDPRVSLQGNRGSSALVETIIARERRAAIGQSEPCLTKNTVCVSPGAAVLAEGRISFA